MAAIVVTAPELRHRRAHPPRHLRSVDGPSTGTARTGSRANPERPVAAQIPLREAPVPWLAIVVGATMLFLLLGSLTIASGRGALSGLAPTVEPVEAPTGAPTVTAVAGDTMWGIARRIQPTGDLRPLVDRLVALNGSADLVPGQAVVLPS